LKEIQKSLAVALLGGDLKCSLVTDFSL
jgi:hypothetical protein